MHRTIVTPEYNRIHAPEYMILKLKIILDKYVCTLSLTIFKIMLATFY